MPSSAARAAISRWAVAEPGPSSAITPEHGDPAAGRQRGERSRAEAIDVGLAL